MEDGSSENPFAPRRWTLVPRVGDTVRLPETQRSYRVLSVEWICQQAGEGSAETEPRVLVQITH